MYDPTYLPITYFVYCFAFDNPPPPPPLLCVLCILKSSHNTTTYSKCLDDYTQSKKAACSSTGLTYVDYDSLAKVMVVRNGLEGSNSRILAVGVGSFIIIVAGQFGQGLVAISNMIQLEVYLLNGLLHTRRIITAALI